MPIVATRRLDDTGLLPISRRLTMISDAFDTPWLQQRIGNTEAAITHQGTVCVTGEHDIVCRAMPHPGARACRQAGIGRRSLEPFRADLLQKI
jgi:hypothetical protein